MKQLTEIKIIFYKTINKIIFDKFAITDPSVSNLLRYSQRQLFETNTRISWPNIGVIQRQVRAWRYAIISSGNEWAIKNISEKMLNHIYRVMYFLKPENQTMEILERYKSWIFNENEKFQESINIMKFLKEILELNVNDIEAEKIQQVIDIFKKVEKASLLELGLEI